MTGKKLFHRLALFWWWLVLSHFGWGGVSRLAITKTHLIKHQLWGQTPGFWAASTLPECPAAIIKVTVWTPCEVAFSFIGLDIFCAKSYFSRMPIQNIAPVSRLADRETRAKLVIVCGVSESTVRNWVKSPGKIRALYLRRIAAVLGCTVDSLIP